MHHANEIRCWTDLAIENAKLRLALDAAAEAIDALAKCNTTTDKARHQRAMAKIEAWSAARVGLLCERRAA